MGIEKLPGELKAIRDGVDAFNPDARMAARSAFDAAERVWKMTPEIIEALTTMQEREERLNEMMAEIQMNGFNWMRAHDKLKAGKPYDLPKPADLPEALAAMQAREATLIRVLRDLVALWEGYQDSDLSQMNAHDCLVRYEVWNKANEALGTSGLVER
jgi:hypothetical protein